MMGDDARRPPGALSGRGGGPDTRSRRGPAPALGRSTTRSLTLLPSRETLSGSISSLSWVALVACPPVIPGLRTLVGKPPVPPGAVRPSTHFEEPIVPGKHSAPVCPRKRLLLD